MNFDLTNILGTISKNSLKEGVRGWWYAAFFLSLLLIEYSVIPNRIILGGLILLHSRRLRSVFSRHQPAFGILHAFWILPILYGVIWGCGLDLAVLYVVLPLAFMLGWLIVTGSSGELGTCYRGLFYALLSVFAVCMLNQAWETIAHHLPFETLHGSVRTEGLGYWWNNFTHKNLLEVIGIHPSYLALFILAALSWELVGASGGNFEQDLFSGRSLRIVFLVLFNILVASKMGIMAMLIMLVATWFFAYGKLSVLQRMLGLGFVLLVLIMIVQMPAVKDRITRDYRTFTQSGYALDNTSNASERIFLWTSAVKVIRENPLGLFCEDSRELIADKNTKAEFSDPEKKNAHNNFLEYGILYGVPGILFLMFFTAWMTYRAFFSRDLFLGFTALVFLLFSLVESTLVRELGLWHLGLLTQIPILYNLMYKTRING